MPTRGTADDVLRSLVAETASTTGREFFAAFVRQLAEALDVSHAYITEYVPESELDDGDGPRLRVIASWEDGAAGGRLEYPVSGMPCEKVLNNGMVVFADRVTHRIPDDSWLCGIEARSYVGVPLRDPTGLPLGHLCVCDRRALRNEELVRSTLSVFAARVAAEFLRLRAEDELSQMNQKLEEMVRERTQQLAEHNTALLATNRKLEDLNYSRDRLMRKLNVLRKTSVRTVRQLIEDLIERFDTKPSTSGDWRGALSKIEREIHFLDETLRPISTLYRAEQAMQSKRVLLAETDLKHQVIAKMALRGTGVELDIASSFEEGRECLAARSYDVVCTNAELIELTSLARAQSPRTASVFMTSAPVPEYLPLLDRYSHLCNIVSRDDNDRTFTLKNILATVGKLISQDLFGLEKYLSWGVDVQHSAVVSSVSRFDVVDQMVAYFQTLGVRRMHRTKAAAVAEELLMNAIYDAPVDRNGRAKYNHLPRTVEIDLEPHECGVIRYACDGVLLAISVEDPFGALDRDTILHYLRTCYAGEFKASAPEKGGAGRGLFQIMEMSDLVVINVKPRIKTEVITIFNLDPDKAKGSNATSLHYFYS